MAMKMYFNGHLNKKIISLKEYSSLPLERLFGQGRMMLAF